MRSLRPQGKVMVQTRFASLNRLITGCHNAHPISTEEPRLVRGSFNLAPPSEPETCVTLAQQSAARRAVDAHFGVSAERNAVATTARQSDISPARGRNGLIHRVSVQCPANSSRKRDELRGSHPHRSKMQPMPKSLVLQGFFGFLGQFF